jgi:predicted amidophosphoribosyltransferase
MSLIPCRSCERPLSKDAKTCPNCGAKKPTKHKKPTDYRRLGKLLLILLAVYVVAIILSKALDLKSNTPSSNSSDLWPKDKNEKTH